MVMVPDVSATWLCDGICQDAIITDFSINSVAPESLCWIHLSEPTGDVNETTESLSVRLYELHAEVARGVSLIEVVLRHDAVVFVWSEVDSESASAGRPREEAIAVL